MLMHHEHEVEDVRQLLPVLDLNVPRGIQVTIRNHITFLRKLRKVTYHLTRENFFSIPLQ